MSLSFPNNRETSSRSIRQKSIRYRHRDEERQEDQGLSGLGSFHASIAFMSLMSRVLQGSSGSAPVDGGGDPAGIGLLRSVDVLSVISFVSFGDTLQKKIENKVSCQMVG